MLKPQFLAVVLTFWVSLTGTVTVIFRSGHVAALVKSHINGLQPFESTIEQTTETMPPSPKTITAATMIKQ